MKKLLILMLLCLVHIAVMAQNAAIHIKGVVQDPYGDPVTGAVVVVKNNLRLGSTTDIDGQFKIKANKYDVLQITYIGFKTLDLPVVNIKDPNNVSVKMEEESQKRRRGGGNSQRLAEEENPYWCLYHR